MTPATRAVVQMCARKVRRVYELGSSVCACVCVCERRVVVCENSLCRNMKQELHKGITQNDSQEQNMKEITFFATESSEAIPGLQQREEKSARKGK